MSVIIKSGDAAIAVKVRPFDQAASQKIRGPAEVAPPEVLALKREIEVLTRQLQQRAEEIDGLKAKAGRAFQEGEARGKAAGLKEAATREEERLSQLHEGIARAYACFEESMGGLGRLAPLLALEGMRKILGDPAHHADIVTRTIRLNLDRLEASAVVRVEVCRADFPDGIENAAAAGMEKLELTVLDELEPGQCRIRLRLGELDVGVGQQWGRLQDLLESLAEPGRPQ